MTHIESNHEFSKIQFAELFTRAVDDSALSKFINCYYFRDYVLNDPTNTINFECGSFTTWDNDSYSRLIQQILPVLTRTIMQRMSHKMMRVDFNTELLPVMEYINKFGDQSIIIMNSATYRTMEAIPAFQKYVRYMQDTDRYKPVMDMHKNLPILTAKIPQMNFIIVLCEYVQGQTVYVGTKDISVCDIALAVKINNAEDGGCFSMTRIDYTLGYKVCDAKQGALFQAFPNKEPYYDNENDWLLTKYHKERTCDINSNRQQSI